MPQTIETIDLGRAEDLIEYVSPFSQAWPGGVQNWLYRGESRDRDLYPAASRKGAFVHVGIGGQSALPVTNLDEQLKYEDEFVREFVTRCIRAGLPIPEDGQLVRDQSLTTFFSSPDLGRGVNFPFALFRSLFALAQHHGVPTRLLDWSQEPAIAAYFACRKVAAEFYEANSSKPHRTGSDPNAPMVVWGLREQAFGELQDAWTERNWEPVIARVEAPYATNPNLAAQRGVFTLVEWKTARDATDFDLPAVNQVLERYAREVLGGLEEECPAGPWLRKLTLPRREARRLLRLLADANVDEATVFPNYDSVVKARKNVAFHL